PHANRTELITVNVVVKNRLGLNQHLLDRAQREATRIYADIGVTLVWEDIASTTAGSQTSDAHCMIPPTIMGLLDVMKGQQHPAPNLMGLATGTRLRRGTVAYVFYTRIQDFAWRYQIPVAQLLGLMVAHEIGHLLLPFNTHSPTGIMRAEWDRAHIH